MLLYQESQIYRNPESVDLSKVYSRANKGPVDRALARSNGILGLVKSARHDTTRIPGNRTSSVAGFLSNEVPCMRLAMVYHTKNTVLPESVDVTLSLVICTGTSARIEVMLSNVSDRCVAIQPSAVCYVSCIWWSWQITMVSLLSHHLGRGSKACRDW